MPPRPESYPSRHLIDNTWSLGQSAGEVVPTAQRHGSSCVYSECTSTATCRSHQEERLSSEACLEACCVGNDDKCESDAHRRTIFPALGHKEVLSFAIWVIPEPPEHQD